MKILFLDQSGKPGGAELCLLDIAKPYRDTCLVGLFADGDFKNLLQQAQIPVEILSTQPILVRKESSLIQGLSSLGQLAPLVKKVIHFSSAYDVIYANTQKALVVGALASFVSRRPLVYHLHDILSDEHFSLTNRRLAVTLANRCAATIANSHASQAAFIKAGGRPEITQVIYNGFDPKLYQPQLPVSEIRQQLELTDKFVIGHFSRLSPWKGQHILITALAQCPEDTTAIFVGDALFGEQNYVKQLQQQVKDLKLEHRVKFLGFRSDIPELMIACDIVAHTSIAAEPFGRVIVEAMLCGRPVIATAGGGASEIVQHGINGFLVTPGNPQELATTIATIRQDSTHTATIAQNARTSAIARFDVATINQQIAQLLKRVTSPD